MIISGGSRCNGKFFAGHLMRGDQNEHVSIIEMRGLASEDLRGAFSEMEALASGTKCKNYFYHAALNPRANEHLTPEQRDFAVDKLEGNLGLTGHSRFIVEHEKDGRRHWHIIWSRIDPDTMKAVRRDDNYAKHEQTSRELEAEFGHEPVQGAHVGRDGQRMERRPKNWEVFRSHQSDLDPDEMKRQVTALFQEADSGQAFKAALEDAGFILTRGDKRDFCLVDSAGHEHSLGRRIAGFKAAEIRERMKDVDREELMGVAEAREWVRAQSDTEEGPSDKPPGEWKPPHPAELPGERRPQGEPVLPGSQAQMFDQAAGTGITRAEAEDGTPQRVTPWGNAWRAFADRFTEYADRVAALWHDEGSGAPMVQPEASTHADSEDSAAKKSWVERVTESRPVQAGLEFMRGYRHRDGDEMRAGLKDAASAVEDILAKGPQQPGTQDATDAPMPEPEKPAPAETPKPKSAFERLAASADTNTPAADSRPKTAFERLAASADTNTPPPGSRPKSAFDALMQKQPGAEARRQPQAPQPRDYPVPEFD